MDNATLEIVKVSIGALVGGGSVLALGGKYIERRWGRQDRREEGHATVEVRQIESHDGTVRALQEQINSLVKRHDDQIALLQQRFDDKEIKMAQRIDALQLQLDEWKDRYFKQQGELVKVQGELLVLQKQYTALESEHHAVKRNENR